MTVRRDREEGPLIPDVVVYSVGSCLLFVLVSIQLTIWIFGSAARHTRSSGGEPDDYNLPFRTRTGTELQLDTVDSLEQQAQSAEQVTAADPEPEAAAQAGHSGNFANYEAGWLWLLRRVDFEDAFALKGNIAAVDIDGDGNDELLVHNPLSSTISYFSIAERSLLATHSNERLLGDGSQLVYGWDHDGDRQEDAVVDRAAGAILFSRELGRIDLEPQCRVDRRLPPADFDGDRFTDILCLGLDGSWYEVRARPDGRLWHGPQDGGSGPNSLMGFADFNADGRAELLEWDVAGRRTLIIGWNPDKRSQGRYGNKGRMDVASFPGGFQLGALDMNGDKVAELFSADGWFDSASMQQTELWSGWGAPEIGEYLLVNFAASKGPLGVAVPRMQGGHDAIHVFDAAGNVLLASRPAGNIASVCVARLDGRDLCLVLTKDGVLLLKLLRSG